MSLWNVDAASVTTTDLGMEGRRSFSAGGYTPGGSPQPQELAGKGRVLNRVLLELPLRVDLARSARHRRMTGLAYIVLKNPDFWIDHKSGSQGGTLKNFGWDPDCDGARLLVRFAVPPKTR